jgi:ATP-dependent Clp protease protease subunit
MALPNARVLIHQPYAQSGYAQVSDLEIAANEILRLKETLERVLSRHTGQTIEKIAKDTDRDYVLTAAEAKEYGIIDEVIEERALVDNSGAITAVS